MKFFNENIKNTQSIVYALYDTIPQQFRYVWVSSNQELSALSEG